MTKIKGRELDLDALVLAHGAHEPDHTFCVLEAVAWVAGEPWSDHPSCASRVIGAFLRNWNDSMGDADRQMLKPLIPRLVGTAASAKVETKRAWMATDWLARVQAPAWFRLANRIELAESLEGLSELVDAKSATAAQPTLDAARDAAWDAARDAARAAARDAARDAAGAAAWAAARDAAWDAAGGALRPTVVTLQRSALELVVKMIEVQSAR